MTPYVPGTDDDPEAHPPADTAPEAESAPAPEDPGPESPPDASGGDEPTATSEAELDPSPEAEPAPAVAQDPVASGGPTVADLPRAEHSDPALSAMDRVQSREAEADESGGMSWSWLGGLAIFVLTVVGVWFWTNREAPQEASLLRHAADVAVEYRVDVVTDDPNRAASYVLEEFGLSLFPPELDGFVLLGVGAAELVPGVVVPAYRYDGRQGVTAVVFAYDYILLDQAAAQNLLSLAPEVYARLAEPEPVDSRRVGNAFVVTWRRRAMVFTAVAPGQEAAERILQSVRRPEI